MQKKNDLLLEHIIFNIEFILDFGNDVALSMDEDRFQNCNRFFV